MAGDPKCGECPNVLAPSLHSPLSLLRIFLLPPQPHFSTLLQDAPRRPRSATLVPLLHNHIANISPCFAGLLIECDPSIKSMILKYDEERHDYIVEDLDDENHLVIKESQLQNLKVRLDQVFEAHKLSGDFCSRATANKPLAGP
jgi:TFIIH basal transcription factor complex TTD-A subunit